MKKKTRWLRGTDPEKISAVKALSIVRSLLKDSQCSRRAMDRDADVSLSTWMLRVIKASNRRRAMWQSTNMPITEARVKRSGCWVLADINHRSHR